MPYQPNPRHSTHQKCFNAASLWLWKSLGVLNWLEWPFKYYQRTCESFAYWRWRCSSHSFCNLSIRTDSRLLPLLPYILTVYQTQDSSLGHWIETRREDWPVLASKWCLKATRPHFSGTSVGYVGGTWSGGTCNRCTPPIRIQNSRPIWSW